MDTSSQPCSAVTRPSWPRLGRSLASPCPLLHVAPPCLKPLAMSHRPSLPWLARQSPPLLAQPVESRLSRICFASPIAPRLGQFRFARLAAPRLSRFRLTFGRGDGGRWPLAPQVLTELVVNPCICTG
ncbi:hypothetical protein ZWY2020_029429 [Hordeum vulgare]|nr:hypothetical protein ZWY2020_029429 [Hordeum vulgare]